MKEKKNCDPQNCIYYPKKIDKWDIAKDHVDWFLDTLRPLLMSHFLHGYKHGFQRKLSERRKG